jgi:hypothetical protein
MDLRSGIALSTLPLLLLAACGPDRDRDDANVGAEAAEAPPATRPAETPFASWDQNQDRLLQRAEFNAWARDEGLFDDMVGDDGLDREALNQRIYDRWDMDGDGTVTEIEWQAGAGDVYDLDYGNWTDWDADGDSQLDMNELAEAHERIGFWNELDRNADGRIDDEDLGDWFFNLFDTNDNDALDPQEWDMGRGGWFEDGMGM